MSFKDKWAGKFEKMPDVHNNPDELFNQGRLLIPSKPFPHIVIMFAVCP